MNDTYYHAKQFEQMKPINSIAHAKECYELLSSKNCHDRVLAFTFYIPEIIPIIEQVISSGRYPYNRVVEEECRKDIFFNALTDAELGHFVYTTQSWRHSKKDKETLDNYLQSAKENGFIEPTENIVNELAAKRQLVTIQALGKEPFKARPLIDANKTLFWMPPRNTRKGYNNLTLPMIKL